MQLHYLKICETVNSQRRNKKYVTFAPNIKEKYEEKCKEFEKEIDNILRLSILQL